MCVVFPSLTNFDDLTREASLDMHETAAFEIQRAIKLERRILGSGLYADQLHVHGLNGFRRKLERVRQMVGQASGWNIRVFQWRNLLMRSGAQKVAHANDNRSQNDPIDGRLQFSSPS